MPLWDKNNPPTFFKNAVQTKAGWVNEETGEVLVAISDLTDKSEESNILSVRFEHGSYAREQELKILVRFAEKVDVVSGATLEVSTTGNGGNFVVTADAQSGVYDVIFEGIVPDEEGILSIATQTILGDITDTDGGAEADLLVSPAAASGAGSRSVV